MSKVLSSKIKIYPSAYRGKNEEQGKIFNPESRLFTEENITRPFIAFADFSYEREHDSGSFVISNTYDSSKPFEFIVKGYYFKLLDPSTVFTDSSATYYAQIKLSHNTSADPYNINFYPWKLASNSESGSLDIYDETSQNFEFVGLEIVTEIPSTIPDNTYYLLLLEENEIPLKSKLKINPESIYGGENYKPINKSFVGEKITLSDKIQNAAGTTKIDFAHETAYIAGLISSPNMVTQVINDYGDDGFKIEVLLNDLEMSTSNNASLEAQKTIRIEANKGSLFNDSVVELKSGTTVEDYVFPFVSEGEPTFTNNTPHHVATWEWLNSVFNTSLSSGNDTVKFSINNKTYTKQITSVNYSNNSVALNENLIPANSSSNYCLIGTSGFTSGTGYLSHYKLYKNSTTGLYYNANYNRLNIEDSGSSVTESPTSTNSNVNVGNRGIYCAGGIKSNSKIEASYFNVPSDIRLKENIEKYDNKNSILNLDVVEFNYKGKNEKRIGCIAQDLQKICPEIVSKDNNGMLSVEESKIVYLLLNEVKRLNKEVEKLKVK